MDFANWPKENLVRYLQFLIHNYRVMDAFWFINLEQAYGLETACRFNEQVWGRVSQLAAKDIVKRFDIKQGGLDGFEQALRLFPWTILVGYEFKRGANSLEITVPNCPAQAARLEKGLGEYPCQAMHLAEFKGFAGQLDPDIRVECLFAPPDPHPAGCFCHWRFTVGNKTD